MNYLIDNEIVYFEPTDPAGSPDPADALLNHNTTATDHGKILRMFHINYF